MIIKKLNNKVVKAASWYTLTDMFVKGITFLTIPIFTRLLTPHEYGIVSVYLTWVSIFSILLSLDVKNSVSVAKYDFEKEYDQYTSSILSMCTLIFIISLILLFPLKGFMTQVTNLSGILLFLMLLQSYFTNVNDIVTTKLRFEYKYKINSVIKIFMSLLGVILSIVLINTLLSETKYLGKILGNMIVVTIFGAGLLFIVVKEGKCFYNKKYWKYALLFSIPLLPHSLSSIANAQFDRIIINKYLGASETGIYSFAYNIGMIINVIRAAFDQAWNPWAYDKISRNQIDELRQRSLIYRDVFVVFYMWLLFLSPEIIKFMADESYWDGLSLIPWIFIAYYFSFMSGFEINVQRYNKKTMFISIGTIFSALINILLNIIFVPRYGYVAAAITTAISFFTLFIFHLFITKKITNNNIYGVRFHLKSLLYVAVITLAFLITKASILIRAVTLIIISAIIIKKNILKILR